MIQPVPASNSTSSKVPSMQDEADTQTRVKGQPNQKPEAGCRTLGSTK